MNIGNSILDEIADYNRFREIEVSANHSLHTPSFFAKETLEQLQRFLYGKM